MRIVLSQQKNDINNLADQAEWDLICARENRWGQVMPGSHWAVDHTGTSLCSFEPRQGCRLGWHPWLAALGLDRAREE